MMQYKNWSGNEHPTTPPFDDIEDAFDIAVDDDAVLELYDMHLDEAADKILEIRRLQADGKAAAAQ